VLFHNDDALLYPSGVTDFNRLKDVPMSATDPLLEAIPGAERRELGGVQLIKPHVGTETCMHAHVGFLARGRIHMEFPDGCTLDYAAPQVILIEPGHDGRVVGNEPAIVIEFDFENETAARLGLPDRHHHGK
jgi:hypothetical protein